MKQSFILHAKYKDLLVDLSQSQKGDLLDALFVYSATGEVPEMEAVVKMAFRFIAKDVDYHNEKYEERCEKNRQNVLKRWSNTNDGDGIQEDTNVYDGIRADTKHTDKDKEKDKDKGKDKERDISTNVDNVSFLKFIEAFNLKRKSNFKPIGSVKKKYEARLKEGYTSKQLMMALLTAMKDDFHRENNFKYLTPEFICRSDKLERYLNLTEKE